MGGEAVGPPVWTGQTEALLDGDGALLGRSFWGLWAQHQDYLRRHSLRWMSNNTADAEDALSAAMLLAQRKYPRHAPGIINPRAWLTRLVHNVCMDHHRSMSRYELVDPLPQEEALGADALPHHHAPTPGPDQEAAAAEMLHLVQKGLRGLSPTLRDPFVLRCIHDLSYGEIADHLGITESAVRKRVQLARDKLRLVLERA